MSWDVMIFALPSPPPRFAEMPDGWDGDPLGPADEVRSRISKLLPEVSWSDPTWGIYEGNGFSYEFNMGTDEPIANVMVHVRGGGDATKPLLQLAQEYGWCLLDTSTTEWLHHADRLEAGWETFQAYRDKVLARVRDEGSEQ